MLSLVSLFLEGLLSFLSPCVLPLIPLYMSYLSSDAKTIDENGVIHYKGLKVFLMTICFVLGISCTFIVIAYSLNSFSAVIDRYKDIIAIIGGTLVIVFGLHETGLINISVLNREFRLPIDLKNGRMSAFKAFGMGFVFSFGWTPCIGPMLTSAILAASTGEYGILYIVVYSLGLIVPFLITGLLTSKVLEFIQKKKSIISYTMVIAGVILILFGGNMIKDASRNVLALSDNKTTETAFRMEYKDIYGNRIDLKEYRGKYVFLNFITSWCTYCKQELPEYAEFAKSEDIKCFYVMSDDYNQGKSSLDFAKENNIELPIINDFDNYLFTHFGVSAFPICFILGPDGSIVGYSNGYCNLNGFINVYHNAIDIYNSRNK